MADVDRFTSDRGTFESRFEARLQAHARAALVPLDASRVARTAIASSTRRASPRFESSPLIIVLLALLMAALAGSLLLVGTKLMDKAPPQLRVDGIGSFAAAGDLHTARSGHTALLLADGRVLVLGGWSGAVRQLPAEIYDPATGTFTELDPLATGLNQGPWRGGSAGFTATLLDDGRVLVTGGHGVGAVYPSPPEDQAILWSKDGPTRPTTGPMTVARADHVAIRLRNGQVLIAGGVGVFSNGDQHSLASAELYDPATGTFAATSPMTTDRSNACCSDREFTATLLADGRVLLSGGQHWTNIVEGNGSGQDVSEPDEVYDPANGTFTSVPAGHPPSGQPDIVVVSANHVDRHDLRTGEVTFIAPDPADLVARYGGRCAMLPADCRVNRTATILADGRILLAGGSTVEPLPPSDARYDLRYVLMPVAEVFDPVSGTASPTGPMVQPREGHTATLLADGRVVVIGGVDPDQPFASNGVGRLLSSAEIFSLD